MAYDILIGRNESDKKLFEKKGTLFIGKSYVKMGQYTSLNNRILMDIARSHVLLIAGKRGSGKSYTMGVIAEEISNLPKEINQNIATLMFDTMGIYWTMKFRNEKDKELLKEWGLKPKELPVKIFVPFGYFDNFVEKGIPVDKKFALDPGEMSAEDWILTFDLDIINPVAILIERTIYKLKEKKSSIRINDIIKAIEKNKEEKENTKKAAIALFEAALTWGIFAQENQKPTKINDLITRGTTNVLDLSVYNSVGSFNVRALVISLISRKLFNQRMMARKLEEIKSISKGINYLKDLGKKDIPIVWLFIDECHEFLPKTGKTLATDALVQLLREGRQPGISLVLATQQPGQIHHDVMTQSDLILSHRVTSKQDLEALNYIMQSYVLNSITRYLNDLPSLKGSAIVLDDNSERIYPMRMRPRFTWHGGEAPTSISIDKDLE